LAGFGPRAALAVVATFVVSVGIRWDSIRYAGWFNPDEAELLAAGRRAAMQVYLPMATSSANTYLVLWPTSLGSLDLLGVPMTLRTAHVLSTLAYAAVVAMVWVATARRWGWILPAIFIAPAAYWMLARYSDFFELGSEIPCVVLLVLAAVIGFPPNRAVSARRLAVVAALASLAPWFKVQSGLLAVAVVVSACGFAYLSRDAEWNRPEWVRRLALLTMGGLAPTMLLLAVMAAGGTLDLLWDEPVAFLHAYLTGDVKGLGFGLGETSAPLSVRLSELGDHLLINVFAFSWALLGLRTVWSRGHGSTGRRVLRVGVWAAPMLAAFATLLVQYPIHVHYLNFLFAGTAISAVAAAGLAGPRQARTSEPEAVPIRRQVLTLGTLATVVLGLFALEHAGGDQEFAYPAHQDDALLRTHCPNGSSVFVWGWAAELYAYYDWQPASRYVTYGLLLAQTPNQDNYRARFLEEMKTHPPRCIVNAVGPRWFGGNTADMVLEKEIPETRAWLERCYQASTVELGPAGDPRVDSVTVWSRQPNC
jgi:hypothetical protein